MTLRRTDGTATKPISNDTLERKFNVADLSFTEPKAFDFLDELSENYSQYYIPKAPGAQWIQIVQLPSDLLTTLEKVCGCSTWKKLGIAPAICCAVTHGLPIIAKSDPSKEFERLKERFDSLKQQGTPAEEFVAHYLRDKLPLSFNSGKRRNVAIPDNLKKNVVSTSLSLSVDQSDLAILSTMQVLSEEERVPEGYRHKFAEKIGEFNALMGMKVAGGSAMVELLCRKEKDWGVTG